MDEWELELQLKSVCNDFVSCHSHRHWVVTKRREDLCVLAWKQELDGLYDNWLSLYCKKEKNTINGNWWQVETKMINLQKICDLWPEQSDQNIMDWMDQWSVITRGGICQCRHCRQHCKIFASGVNFSIFTHFWCFFFTKTVEIRRNWRCKMFSLKIWRFKIFDKFHVWW